MDRFENNQKGSALRPRLGMYIFWEDNPPWKNLNSLNSCKDIILEEPFRSLRTY
jgi:hypothetical protein